MIQSPAMGLTYNTNIRPLLATPVWRSPAQTSKVFQTFEV